MRTSRILPNEVILTIKKTFNLKCLLDLRFCIRTSLILRLHFLCYPHRRQGDIVLVLPVRPCVRQDLELWTDSQYKKVRPELQHRNALGLLDTVVPHVYHFWEIWPVFWVIAPELIEIKKNVCLEILSRHKWFKLYT